MSEARGFDSETLKLAKNAVRRDILLRTTRFMKREKTEPYQYGLMDDAEKEEQYVIPKENVIIALMVAPRRCGKTTLMISIAEEFKRVMGDGFDIKPVNGERIQKFEQRRNALREFSGAPIFYSGVEASDSLEIYEFILYSKQRPRNAFLFRFIDVPGEWVKSYPEEMRVLIDGSDILYLTVNTPALLEDNGKYCEEINAVGNILSLTDELCSGKISNHRRLILFVPIKCEKYYWESFDNKKMTGMRDASLAVEKKYEPLIGEVLRNDSTKKNTTVAITPILTVGGVKFSQFRRITQENKTSMLSEEYIRINGYINDREGYSPRLCEQPMLYTMRFISEIVRQRLKKENLNTFCKDWKRCGFKKSFRYAYRDPLYERLNQVTRSADFREFQSEEDYLMTESISCNQPKKTLPQGVYVNNYVLGIRILNDPNNIFGTAEQRA